MKNRRIISLLMAALSSTSSLMATKGRLNLNQNRGGTYTKQLSNADGKRKRKLRIRNAKNLETLNLPLPDGNFKDNGGECLYQTIVKY